MGHDVLKSADAITQIIDAARKVIFPLQAQEAKELYRVGASVGGVMSRQAGESMTSYIGRRKRWYRKLKELDKTIEISDTILGDLLLDNSGLDRKERLMVLTAVGETSSFDAIEKALITQHGKLHVLESRSSGKGASNYNRPRGMAYKGTKSSGKGKANAQTHHGAAYLAEPEDLFDSYDAGESFSDPEAEEEELVPDDQDSSAFMADSLGEATAEKIELDVVEAFLSTPDFSLDDDECIAFLASACQAEVCAFFARSKAKGKGKPMGKHAHGYRPKPSGLSIEDRKAKLKEIKARSVCRTCGKKGHWAGDRDCKGKPSSGGSSTQGTKDRTAHFSAILTKDASVQTSFCCSSSESEGSEVLHKPQMFLALDDDHEHPEGYPGFFNPGDFAEEEEELEEADGSFELLEAPPEGSDTVFGFGVHRGSTFGDVVLRHPDYFTWGIKEKNPSRTLEEFLVWCNMYYVFPRGKAERREYPLSGYEARDLESVKAWMLSQGIGGKVNKSKLANLKPDPRGPCQGGCPAHAISKAGSNDKVIKTTCMICGHRWSEPRPQAQPTRDAATCPHSRTDNRGSTRAVHKVWCLDCCTFVEEMPQALHKQQVELGRAAQQAPLKAQDLTRRTLQDTPLTQMEAGEVIKHFVKNMNRYLTRVESTSSQELLSMLSDSVDFVVASQATQQVLGTASSSSGFARRDLQAQALNPVGRSPPGTPAHASAAAAVLAPRTPPRTPQRPTAPQLPERGSPPGYPPHAFMAVETPEPVLEQLEEVDPLRDDHVYAMLDEGCNSTCHGEKWRIDAEKKLEKLGFRAKAAPLTVGTYRGIGGAEATQRLVFPIALAMEPSQLSWNGSVASNEIGGQDFPLLLSLQVQQKLGLRKDVRAGLVQLADYPGQSLRLFKNSRTGLLMIRIDQFEKDLAEGHQEFRLEEYPNLPKVGHQSPSRTVMALRSASPVQRAYMIADTKPNIVLMSAGVWTLDVGAESSKVSKELTDAVDRIHANRFSVALPKNLELVKRSLRKNYPIITEEVKSDDHLVILDVREIPDPKNYRDHIGTYPENLHHTVYSKTFLSLWEEIAKQIDRIIRRSKDGDKIIILFLCTGGKHRSVALRHLVQVVLENVYGICAGYLDVSRTVNWHKTCQGCTRCRHVESDDKEILEEMEAYVVKQWKGFFDPSRTPVKGRSRTPAGTWVRKDGRSDASTRSSSAPKQGDQQLTPGTGATPKAMPKDGGTPERKGKASTSTDVKDTEKDKKKAHAANASAKKGARKAEAGDSLTSSDDDLLGTSGVPEHYHDFSDLIEEDHRDLERIAYIFIHRIVQVFQPDALTKPDTLIRKYSDSLVLAMGAVARKYLDEKQARQILEAVLRLRRLDIEGFNAEYLEKSLRAATEMVDELDEATPDFGTRDVRDSMRGRSLGSAAAGSRDNPRSRSARGYGRSATPVRKKWHWDDRRDVRNTPRKSREEEAREYQERRDARESRESQQRRVRNDQDHERARSDLLGMGIDPNLPSEITSAYLDQMWQGDPRTSKKPVLMLWVQDPKEKNGPVRVTLKTGTYNTATKVAPELKNWYKNTFVQREEGGDWSWAERWEWPTHVQEFSEKTYRVAIVLCAQRMNHS